MNKTNMMKKFMITGLTFAMVLGGSTAAFAHGNDKDKDKGNEKASKEKSSHEDSAKKVTVKGKGNFKFSFDDIKGADVAWSAKNIASLASKEVFEGDGYGNFRPRDNVKRIEAITAAVRLLGLKDKAESAAEMATVLNFKDADKIVKEYAWAVGYVAVAAENDLFAETDASVQPEKAASRLWATTLLVKALKLDAEAKAKINTKLTFKDAKEIPAGSVGYVAVALEKGLITGFEDNTFRPDTSVTRAQLAALLDRTNDQIVGNDAVKGAVTAVVTNNTLTIKNGNVAQTIALDPNVFVFKGGVKVAASAIVVGDEVKIHLYNGVAVFVEVVKVAPVAPVDQSFTVNGLYSTHTWNADGKINTITVTQNINGVTQTSIYAVAANAIIEGDQTKLVLSHELELKGNIATVNKIKIK
ncbi:S-layer homology domain-containing protein [Paenibacillus psychroresistens]|uniref:S-layer homology domain-containing protein n=1 Tax=Paenibacillus psychroresistens TaxID=1778678 RepID=A0A6B8RNJ0_9BACL|nr:S-layer homology domain-containing protein [Paenibacillus psychroresistens]QGQ97890.1 S-layer homology domain-containing protein [Paenibacillus psychroresistens]